MTQIKTIEADPAFRKRFIVECSVLLAFGLVLILWFYPEFLKPLILIYPAYSFWVIEVLVISILTIMALSWFGIMKTGYHTVQQMRYPPENTKVLKSTQIIEGEKAVRRGKVLMVLSGFCVAACVAMAIWIAHEGVRILMG